MENVSETKDKEVEVQWKHEASDEYVCLRRVFVFSSAGIELSLESQTDMESAGQQSDDASLPSTSQDPGNIFCLLNIISTLIA